MESTQPHEYNWVATCWEVVDLIKKVNNKNLVQRNTNNFRPVEMPSASQLQNSDWPRELWVTDLFIITFYYNICDSFIQFNFHAYHHVSL